VRKARGSLSPLGEGSEHCRLVHGTAGTDDAVQELLRRDLDNVLPPTPADVSRENLELVRAPLND
jgi:hypothetical protein